MAALDKTTKSFRFFQEANLRIKNGLQKSESRIQEYRKSQLLLPLGVSGRKVVEATALAPEVAFERPPDELVSQKLPS
jgi:hypothetical protein